MEDQHYSVTGFLSPKGKKSDEANLRTMEPPELTGSKSDANPKTGGGNGLGRGSLIYPGRTSRGI